MTTAIEGSVGVVAYLALFAGIGFVFVFVNLLLGYFLRPNNPNEEKLEIYECGEPTIGSSFVQFDLRFYVVALIFIIFDVEVAFLFPWATVFGKAEQLAHAPEVAIVAPATENEVATLTPVAEGLYRELGFRHPVLPAGSAAEAAKKVKEGANNLLWLATVEVLVFFVILLIAFAYEWKLGALDWVRALTTEFREQAGQQDPIPARGEREPVLSA